MKHHDGHVRTWAAHLLATRVHPFLIEEGDCLIWPKGSKRVPHVCVAGNKINIRKLELLAANRILKPKAKFGCSCDNDKCVAYGHIRMRDPFEHARYYGSKGAYSGTVKVMKMSMTKRARSRLTDADVAEIRASTKTVKELEAQYGYSSSYLQDIRNGKLWKTHGSPFSGLFNAPQTVGPR